MKPLQGCRVLDLGIITAGAATSALLADLGAEVIKIESAAYRDPFRMWTSEPPPVAGDDLPPFFRMTNRGKRSVSLNLKEPEGRDAFLQLVANSDIVVENFSRGVLDRLGIGYAALCDARRDIILASISSQGETGPDSRYVSFGSTLEAVAGMAWMTGYPGDAPVVSGIALNYPDQVVALFAAGMIVAAWRNRQQHGIGAHLDLSQRELTTFLSGDAFAERDAGRVGNAQAPYAVQDCFCSSDGTWIAVSASTAQADAIADLVGPDTGLRHWVASLPAASCIERLQRAGIAAAAVLDARQVMDGMGTEWYLAMQQMPDGRMVKGFPFQFDEDPLAITTQATPLGTDTTEVLRAVGGLSEAAIESLLRTGIAEVAAA